MNNTDDAVLARLTDEVRETFGMAAWQAARARAQVALRQARRAAPTTRPFDGDKVFIEALRSELLRLLVRH